MLRFDIRSLESRAATVDDTLAADDSVWQERDPRPAGGIHVAGRLSTAGSGRFYFSGRITGKVDGECRRCLSEVSAPVADEAHVMFAQAGDAEVDDDPDVFQLDPREHALDLRPAVREQWLLSAPAFLECRADCAGICPTCGTDLNSASCSCKSAAPPDARWEGLRKPGVDPS